MLCMDVYTVYIYIYTPTYVYIYTHMRARARTKLLLRPRVNKKMWLYKHSIDKMTQPISASQRIEKRSENMREMRAYYG